MECGRTCVNPPRCRRPMKDERRSQSTGGESPGDAFRYLEMINDPGPVGNSPSRILFREDPANERCPRPAGETILRGLIVLFGKASKVATLSYLSYSSAHDKFFQSCKPEDLIRCSFLATSTRSITPK